MRPFSTERKTSKDQELSIQTTNSYIECEYPVNDNTAYVVYVIPRNENSVWIAACFEHIFDELVSNFDEDTSKTIAETYPTLNRLLCNGMKNRYQEGALAILEDSDYCENKCFVVSIAGNISFESPEDFFGERMLEVIKLVISTSITLLVELEENKPNMLREFGKGFLKGVGLAVTATVFAFLGIDSE